MKSLRNIVGICFAFVLSSCQLPQEKVNYTGVKTSEIINVRTTAYTHSERDHRRYKKKNAIGTNLQYYSGIKSAAADWSKFPVETEFKLNGDRYIIDDYGSALVGKNTIDLYKPSKREMNKWGVRMVVIEIIKWGDSKKSLDILKGRLKFWHVRRMYNNLIEKHEKRHS